MLKLEHVNFPITFNSHGNGEITFNTKDYGLWEDGEVSTIDLDHFIKQHNIKNPNNSRKKDYYYYSISNEQNTHNTSIQYAPIENMPIGATLKGVQLDVESWLEITIEPKSIEVCEDVVKLTSHHGTIGNKTENRGISIKRGTLVRYDVK